MRLTTEQLAESERRAMQDLARYLEQLTRDEQDAVLLTLSPSPVSPLAFKKGRAR